MGTITVKKTDAGVAWGSVHWQYLEDMSKVTPHDGTPLKLKKTLYTRTLHARRARCSSRSTGPLAGRRRAGRAGRAAHRPRHGVRPPEGPPRQRHRAGRTCCRSYRYQDGLAYYESTRDTASHFFIDYLPKGTYVFEYAVRVQHRGQYQTGMAEIQCMYAPEFGGHSQSIVLEAR